MLQPSRTQDVYKRQLKDRLCAMLGETANDIWASTFHSTCARILRRDGERIGYSSHFTVYDTDDQRRLMKSILKELDLSLIHI